MGKKLVIAGADFSANGIAPEYIELAWIGGASSATSALIVSGLTSNCKIVANFAFDKTKVNGAPSSTYFMGLVTTNATFAFMQTSTPDVYAYWVTLNNLARVAATNIANGNDATVELSKYGIKVNTKAIVAPKDEITEAFNIPYLGLDACVDGNGAALSSSYSASNSDPAMRLKSVKIYSNVDDENSLIVDAIPVKRTEDNVVCLFNKVDSSYIERGDGTQPAYGEIE